MNVDAMGAMSGYDVCVVGGGPAGTAAAIAAGRCGARTVLVEATTTLGGMGSAALVSFFCTAHHDKERSIIGGIFAEIRARLLVRGAIYTAPGGNPKMLEPYDPDVYAAILHELCDDAGVDLRCGERVAEIRADEIPGARTAITLQLVSGATLTTATLVDATGDATMARELGVPCRKGRDGDGAVMPVSECYLFGPVDLDAVAAQLPECVCVDPPTGDRFLLVTGSHPTIDAAIAEERAAGRLDIPRDHIAAMISVPGRPTVAAVNFTRADCADPTDPQERARAAAAAARQVEQGAEFFRRRLPGCAAGGIVQRALVLGVRQSYQIEARHILSGDEARDCTQFDDVIAQCAYAIDIHEPGSDQTTFVPFAPGTHFDIPLRSLIPRQGPPGLIVAGRCIGADTTAMSSFRVQSAATAIGEAAGVTAALAARAGGGVADVDAGAVQDRLRATGGILA